MDPQFASVYVEGEAVMRTLSAVAVILFLFITRTANAGPCERLSYQRNAFYKSAGYCFKTAEQIRIFGNAGCRYDEQADVPLSQRDRAEVAGIVREERAIGRR